MIKKLIEFSDKLQKIAIKENNQFYHIKALLNKAYSYTYTNFYNKANSTINEATSIANNLNGDDFYSAMGDIYQCKAEIKNIRNNIKERLICNKTSITYYSKIKNIKKKDKALSVQYHNLGISYLDFQKQDSAIYYNNKAIYFSKIVNSSTDEAIAYYGIGRAYLETDPKKLDSVVYYYNKVLPIFIKMNDSNRLKYLYEDLATVYEELGNIKKYIYYSKKAKEITKNIEDQEDILTDEISTNILADEEQKWYQQFYIIVVGFILAIIGFIVLTIKLLLRYKKIKELKRVTEISLIEKYEAKLLEKLEIRNKEKEIAAVSNISDEKEHELIKKLNNFENKEQFLSSDISLGSMASTFNTNVNYLSKVIKKYRDHNFNGYINELRINYITKKLRSNPEYLNYKIAYLAEECGYSSYSSFVSIFKQQTGLTPSKFIEYLSKEVPVS